MGAKDLLQDNELVSVQGHLIMLEHENPANIDYLMLVYFDKDKTAQGNNITRSFYIFPKKSLNAKPGEIGVLGGTFIEGADSSTPNTEEFQIMVDGAKKFYGITH